MKISVIFLYAFIYSFFCISNLIFNFFTLKLKNTCVSQRAHVFANLYKYELLMHIFILN